VVVIPVTRTVQAQALFSSFLQPSDRPSAGQVAQAVRDGLRRHGGAEGCAAVVAAEYGEHPVEAAARMRWALAVTSLPGTRPLPAVPARTG
jgi:hypothetical protein